MRKDTTLAKFFATTGAHHPMTLIASPKLRARMTPNQVVQLKKIIADGQEDAFAGLDCASVTGLDKTGNRDLRMNEVLKFKQIILADKFSSISTDTLLLSDYENKQWTLREGQVRSHAISMTDHIVLMPIRVGVSRDSLLNDSGTQIKPHMAIFRWANHGGSPTLAPYLNHDRWDQGLCGRFVSMAKCVHKPLSARRQGMTNYELAAMVDLLGTELWIVADQFVDGHWAKDYSFKQACHMAPFVIALRNGMSHDQVRHAMAVFTRNGSFVAESLDSEVMHQAADIMRDVPMASGANSRDCKERAYFAILLNALDAIRHGRGNKLCIPDKLKFGNMDDVKAELAKWRNPLAALPQLKLAW